MWAARTYIGNAFILECETRSTPFDLRETKHGT